MASGSGVSLPAAHTARQRGVVSCMGARHATGTCNTMSDRHLDVDSDRFRDMERKQCV